MNHPIGRAIFFDGGFAKVKELPRLPRAVEADLLALGNAGDGAHGLAKAERDEDARAIGAELQARADLAQLLRLFVDIDRKALLDKGQRRHEAADSSSGDGDGRMFGHHFQPLKSGDWRAGPCGRSSR